MQIIDNLIIIILPILAFISGIWLANKYNAKAAADKERALQTQFLRLRANVDADDPCKPYAPQNWAPPMRPIDTGDYDGDVPPPINTEFMDRLKQNGKAAIKFNKADIAK